MPSPTTGYMQHDTTNQTDQLQRNVLKRLLQVDYEQTPLYTFLAGGVWDKRISPLEFAPTYGPTFEVFEIDSTPVTCLATADHNNSTTTLTLDDTSPFLARENLQVIRNQGEAVGEVMRIESVDSGTQITVENRGMFNSTAAVIKNGAMLKKVGTAVGTSGVDSKGIVIPRPEKHIGSIQYQMEECGAEAARLAMAAFWGGEWPGWFMQKVNDLKLGVENSFWYNYLADYTTTCTIVAGQKVLTTDGVNGRVTTHRFKAAGCSYLDLCDHFAVYRRNNKGASDMKLIAFAPIRSINHINEWGTERIRTSSTVSGLFGFNTTQLVVPGVPGGILPIVHAPILDEGIFESGMVVLSFGRTNGQPHIRGRYLQEQAQPRGKNWSIQVVDETGGTDITPIGYTAKVLRRVECMVGLELNIQKRHIIFETLASPIV